MLPLEILLSSIDIGVDRVGSRLPLQGRCACLRVGLGFHLLHVVDSGGDVWFFTKTLPFLGLGSYFFCYPCVLVLLLSLSRLCRLPFGPPSDSVPAHRSEKEAAAEETSDRHNVEGTDNDVRGWEGHPSYPLSPSRM